MSTDSDAMTKYPAYEVVEWRGQYKVIEYAKLDTGWRFDDGAVATSLCQRLNALHKAAAAAREAFEALNVTVKVTTNGLQEFRSLCWKGDYDGISDSELRAEVLRWLEALEKQP